MRELIIDKGAQEIQFLHANAYPPECYRPMVAALGDYKISLPYQRQLWPNSDPSALNDWSLLTQDLITHMDEQGKKGVIGMGHSMGGIVSFLAAIERPDLFQKLIFIDPVILPEKFIRYNKVLPYWIKKRMIPVVKIALKRRDQWKDRNEVDQHLGSKKVFKRWDRDCWREFLQYGIKDNEAGVTLSFSKAWEARVYATAPNVWDKLSEIKVPTTIIKAEFSDVITATSWSKIEAAIPGGTHIEMKGVGHLMPFEKPMELARLIVSDL